MLLNPSRIREGFSRDVAPESRTGVHVGRDGWLFWVGRRGEMCRLYRDGVRVRLAVWRWTKLIERRRARAQALGSRYFHVVAPEKLSVYDDRLARPFLDGTEGIGSRLARSVLASPAAECWIDLLGRLRAARDHGPNLYHKTDTHWAYAGALIAAETVCSALGITPPRHISEPKALDPVDFTFDLGTKLRPPVVERLSPETIQIHAARVEENALARIRREPGMANAPGFHVGSRMVLRTGHPEAAPLRVVLFGDSYSSEYGFTLGVMLAESVAELHSVWSANIDWAYVERVRPDIVIGEIAERFLRKVPNDRFDADAFAAERVARRRAPGVVAPLARLVRRAIGR